MLIFNDQSNNNLKYICIRLFVDESNDRLLYQEFYIQLDTNLQTFINLYQIRSINKPIVGIHENNNYNIINKDIMHTDFN